MPCALDTPPNITGAWYRGTAAGLRTGSGTALSLYMAGVGWLDSGSDRFCIRVSSLTTCNEGIMPSSQDDSGIVETVLNWPPVDARYRWGMHRDRATLRGVWVEAKVVAKALSTRRNSDVRKFLIVGRARSGTTLLTQLLSAHPEIQCDREVLGRFVTSPVNFLQCLASKSRTTVYGAKLLSYQMVQVQRFRDPVGFLRRLQAHGWQLIHLHRVTFDQTLSQVIAGKTRIYHQKSEIAGQRPAIVLDPEAFCRRIVWNDLLLRYERWCLGGLDHLEVGYEADLQTPQDQQNTVNRLAHAFGVAPVATNTEMHKVLPRDPRRIVANYDEVIAAMIAHDIGHLAPQPA
jgi:LPS sulfotransferase NodH